MQKKKHAKQTKKVGLGKTPPPSMGKIPTFYRFFSGEPPLTICTLPVTVSYTHLTLPTTPYV